MSHATRLLMAASAVSLAIAPVAATANTRASDTSPTYTSSASKPGKGRDAKGEKLVAPGVLVAILGAAAAAGIFIIIDDGDDDQSVGDPDPDPNQSPGAN
ncbi:MAG: hypothetical protein QNI87_12735 [Erythrobacter sp.]|uniref:hypothetical protein n=1 Tax=Erythrobacter sp. TaxID=1042 RepID=UPI0026351F8A|nr:hypothetical protein [Erythrobacter sp.]MDJ0979385.1 hypothetical protein [Erythrobacter sp.]